MATVSQRIMSLAKSNQEVELVDPSIENLAAMHENISTKFYTLDESLKAEARNITNFKELVFVWHKRMATAEATSQSYSEIDEAEAHRFFSDLSETASNYHNTYEDLLLESEERYAKILEHTSKMKVAMQNLKAAQTSHELRQRMRELRKGSYTTTRNSTEMLDLREIGSLIHTAEALIDITKTGRH